MSRLAGALIAASLAAACTTTQFPATAQTPPPTMPPMAIPPSSSIQPETTISLTGKGSVDRAPDIALISLGVQVEGETAAAAMADQAKRMNAVFAAVKAAGVADRDMQTGNLSLNPVYDYPNNQKPRLRGYQASNQIGIKVRDLTKLGATLDATVKAGGNTINGVSFSIDKPEPLKDQARTDAIKDAAAKAELYARAVGYRVKRIVSISENDYQPPMPVPMLQMARNQVADAAPTPVAAGEVSLEVQVSVLFELTK